MSPKNQHIYTANQYSLSGLMLLALFSVGAGLLLAIGFAMASAVCAALFLLTILLFKKSSLILQKRQMVFAKKSILPIGNEKKVIPYDKISLIEYHQSKSNINTIALEVLIAVATDGVALVSSQKEDNKDAIVIVSDTGVRYLISQLGAVNAFMETASELSKASGVKVTIIK